MTVSRFGQLAFTPAVRRQQEVHGSARAYAAQAVGDDEPDRMSPDDAAFISARDSFYLATVTETGWPYIQHRGGPPGFVHVLDEQTLAFADVRGNRQYVTTGNLDTDDRVSLFFMDYARQARLKVLGHAAHHDVADLAAADPALPERLLDVRTDGKVEQIIVVRVEALAWNCPQHIPQKFTVAELNPVIERLTSRIALLEQQLATQDASATASSPATSARTAAATRGAR
ncbi:pyridoxamine 5'-phosphate oxidase family protein [Pseudonocardia sp. TRM90224]|uniref:pyridoxamine 5'-phosphate oxidase family protein n=1 Tax=Pseudonocardia sp. TRM90224 TaxID=2812678 RepID=UPI001E5279D4|nr:pyridoxamine 5'-phosphate oxidase family protein [Pseudonocardia sp. TRM90224]